MRRWRPGKKHTRQSGVGIIFFLAMKSQGKNEIHQLVINSQNLKTNKDINAKVNLPCKGKKKNYTSLFP